MNSDVLLTEVLIAEVKRLTTYEPTSNQLSHWVRAGLLPEPTQTWPGRGHGRGSVVAWPAECIPRVVLIVSTRKTKNISIDRASRLLVVKGYPPTKPALLRDVLNSLLFHLEQEMQKQRPYLIGGEHDPEEQRHRFDRGLKKRNPTFSQPPQALLKEYAAAIAGLGDAYLTQRLSVSAMREAVHTLSDQELMTSYIEANDVLHYLTPWLWQIAHALSAVSGASTEGSLK